jgi:hypothetical protein
MIRRTLFLLLAPALAVAGPTEDVIVAATQLAEKSSYSWTTTVEDNASTYIKSGSTVRGDLTWVRLPMMDDLRERFGRDAETDIEAYFKNGQRFVVRVGDRWMTDAEVVRASRRFKSPPRYVHGSNGQPYRELFAEPPPYSNAQLAASAPHEELATIVSNFGHLSVQGDVVTGTIRPIGAALLLIPSDDPQLVPLAAGGVFKLWIGDGIVVRYQLALQAMLQIGKRKVHVLQRSDTRITHVDATSLNVPLEVREKLALH